MFKIGMFDMKQVGIHSNELITYNGHLPYYILSVLSTDNVKKRNEYLKGISIERYNNEKQVLKSERKSVTEKLENLKQFLKLNPKYKILIKPNYQELFF